MYRSILELDIFESSVQNALKNCHDMHRNLMRAFDYGDSENPRADNELLYSLLTLSNGKPIIYVTSRLEPDWSRVPGFELMDEIAPKKIDELQYIIHQNDVYRFRLFASPTKKERNGNGNSRRRFLKERTDREAWLERKSEQNGFKVISYDESKVEQVVGKKNKSNISYTGIVFEGLLQVKDKERFWNAYCSGIGPGKSYGLGMLMIKRM